MVRTYGGCLVATVLAIACGGAEPASEKRTETGDKCDPTCAADEECTDGECVDATGKPTEVEGLPSGSTQMGSSGMGGDASAPDMPEGPDSPTPTPTDGEDDPSAPGTALPSSPTPTPTPVDIPTLPPLEGAAGKVDLLFVVDNSLSMAQSQSIFIDSVPHLISRLADPYCLTDDGVNQPSVGGECPAGTTREFAPIADLHVGVVTTSIGAFGAALPCENEDDGDRDNAHLMGSLSRVQAALPGGPTFLSWCAAGSDAECAPTDESDPNVVVETFRNQAAALGESGCGWEATLEALYRFLVEPQPWTQVVRQNCPFAADTNQLCVGPETDENGVQLIDPVVLEQRKAFLRPDSLLAIVALTNENDCSFKASGQSWRLSETVTPVAGLEGQTTVNKAYKGSAACLTDPNGECCVSCGTTALPAGCPSTERDGQTVSAGCEEPRYASTQELAGAGSTEVSDDALNLRCFHQKQRFGVDYLYPVQRYVNALTLPELCPIADDLAPDAVKVSDGTPICTEEQLVQNPLFVDFTYPDRVALDPSAQPIAARPPEFVLFMGIVGVPWQALASDPAATALVYDTDVDWVRVLGNATPGAIDDPLNAPPTDAHMLEQVEARVGTDSAVNGGEWNILDKDELQYACIFPLPAPIDCPSVDEVMPGTPNCDCTYYSDPAYANPVCNGQQLLFGKAFPSIRPLQVIRDLGSQGIATSICAKQTDSPSEADWGYRPAFDRLVIGMRPHLVAP